MPAKISQAVEDNLQAQQTQQMDFVIQKERKEAERKRIEARGIADSQQIISQGLNDKL
ncbi:MAG: prohibitin family protein, partial [Tatlockia sp.]|nr:prohibitin family protein [Tatlockia sp.]